MITQTEYTAIMATISNAPDTIIGKVSFIKSNKNQPLLIMNEYVYKCNKKTAKKKYWVCVVSGCRVSVQTLLNDLYVCGGTDAHFHPPNPELIEVKQVRHQMKERALSEMTPVGMIYDEEMTQASMSSSALAIFPTSTEICEYS